MNDSIHHQYQSYPRVEAVLDAIANWVKRYRYAVGLRNDFARCGPDEVARAAYDLGVSPAELVQLAEKGPDAANQLKAMLRVLGVDAKKLATEHAPVMRDLQRLCITCAMKNECEHALAAGTAAETYHSFCPNAVTLEALIEEG
jgi:hypothetical protein